MEGGYRVSNEKGSPARVDNFRACGKLIYRRREGLTLRNNKGGGPSREELTEAIRQKEWLTGIGLRNPIKWEAIER